MLAIDNAPSLVPHARDEEIFCVDREIARADDGPTALEFFLAMCAEMGLEDPAVLRG